MEHQKEVETAEVSDHDEQDHQHHEADHKEVGRYVVSPVGLELMSKLGCRKGTGQPPIFLAR